MADPLDPAPANDAPLRIRYTDGEWWASVDDITTILTMMQWRIREDPHREMYAPVFQVLSDLLERQVSYGQPGF